MLVVEVYSQLCDEFSLAECSSQFIHQTGPLQHSVGLCQKFAVHHQYFCCYGNINRLVLPYFYAPPTISVLYMKTVLKYWEEFVGVAEIVVYMCVFDLTDVFMFMCVIRRRRCC